MQNKTVEIVEEIQNMLLVGHSEICSRDIVKQFGTNGPHAIKVAINQGILIFDRVECLRNDKKKLQNVYYKSHPDYNIRQALSN